MICLLTTLSQGGIIHSIPNHWTVSHMKMNKAERHKRASETRRKYWEKHVDIDDELDSILNGILISDGTSRENKFQSNVILTSKYSEYIQYVAMVFDNRGIIYKINKNYSGYRTSDGENHKFTSYSIRTASYVEFRKYNRWYKVISGKRTKVIPPDIKIDKQMMLHWYFGDGGLKKRNTSRQIQLSVYAFNLKELKKISLKICKFLDVYPTEVRINKVKAGYTINLIHSIVPRFLEMIGDSPIRCFDYKWDMKNYKHDERNYLLRGRWK